jgi:hypothetical protein
MSTTACGNTGAQPRRDHLGAAVKHLDLSTIGSSRQVSDLSKKKLLRALRLALKEGRCVLVRTLRFLAEVERRKLFAELACSSLWDFCVRQLRFSEDAASRHIAAARLGASFPLVLAKLETGAIHLTGVYMLRRYLRDDNHEELLELATGKTKREIEEIIAARFPREDLRSDIRLAPVLSRDRVTAGFSFFPVSDNPRACDERTIVEALSPGRHRVELTVSSDVRTKLEHARDLMRHRNPSGDFAVVLESALDVFIAKLEKERFGKTSRPRTSVEPGSDLPPPMSKDPDYVSAAVKRVVAERDGYQCAFYNEAGERCPARSGLEYDHVVPKSRGGESTVANVRLLCHPHNLFEARRKLGADFIDECIQTRQAKCAAAKSNRKRASQALPRGDMAAKRNVVSAKPGEEIKASTFTRQTKSPPEITTESLRGGKANVDDSPRARGVVLPRGVPPPSVRSSVKPNHRKRSRAGPG